MGNHVQGVENIVSPDKDGQPDVVKGRVGGRRPENEERADGEWHGEHPHEGDSPTVLERAFVTQTGHERVGNGVNDVADGLDEPDDGEDSRKHVALRNQGGKSGFFRRLVKINQVVVQHGGEQPDREHGQAVDDDGTLRYFFHGISPWLSNCYHARPKAVNNNVEFILAYHNRRTKSMDFRDFEKRYGDRLVFSNCFG